MGNGELLGNSYCTTREGGGVSVCVSVRPTAVLIVC